MKKIISLFLCAVMLMALNVNVNITACASEGGSIEITDSFAEWGVNDDAENVTLFSESKRYTASYKGFSYNNESNTLTLSGVSSKNNAFTLKINNMYELNIRLSSNSSLVGIESKNTNLVISGNGKLFINPAYSWQHRGVKHSKEHISSCPLTFENGNIRVENTADIRIENGKEGRYLGEFSFNDERKKGDIISTEGKTSAPLVWRKAAGADGKILYRLVNKSLSFISTYVPSPEKKPQEKKSISKAKIKGVKSAVYKGKPITLKIKVSLGGKTLKKGTDYSVAYSKNTRVGTATVSIIGKNDYSGRVTKHFKINPKPTKLKRIKPIKRGFIAFISKRTKQTTGYQVQYSLNRKFKKSKKRIVNNKRIEYKAVKGLKHKKKYYVRIRVYHKVGKKNYYSKWSKPLRVKTK